MREREIVKKVERLLPRLPEHVGWGRLVAAYLSLERAKNLGYTNDIFIDMSSEERNNIFKKLVEQSVLKNGYTDRTKTEGDWIAGYYFNNARIRIALLAEISLKYLYYQTKGNTFGRRRGAFNSLIKFYKNNFPGNIPNLKIIYDEINDFKHSTARSKTRKGDDIQIGINAFDELLRLLDLVAIRYERTLTDE